MISRILQEQLNDYISTTAARKCLNLKSRNSIEQFIAQGKLPYLTLNNGTRIFHYQDINKLKK